MKNLKKLLAVIVSICVLATFAVPAFAETKTDAQVVTDLGMVQGTTGGVTADYLATTPARYQAAIMFLRLKGLEDEAAAFVPTENFDDLKGLNEANKAIVGYLKANPDLGFEGIGNNKFAPLKTITAKEYYKVLLTALGYKEGTDFTWTNVFQFAASKGMYALVDNTKFTVNDLAIGTVEGLKAAVKGGTDKLIATLVDAGAITSEKAVATGLYTATPKALEVVSATADNLRTAKIVFNRELNKDTVTTANFANANMDATAPVLLDGGKTVLMVLDSAKTKNNDTENVVIKDVKSTDGVAIAQVTKAITFIDVNAPSITGAAAKNSKTIVINASEPIKDIEYTYFRTFDNIKIDDLAAVATSTCDVTKNTITLGLFNKLAAGTHKITISKLSDYASLVAPEQTFNFEVAADTAAPVMTSAKMNKPTQIEVTFNEDLAANGTFTVNGKAASFTVNGAKATLDLATADALNIGATVEVVVKYKNQKDVEGNEVTTEQSFTFKVPDDTTLPTVTASVGSDNVITLTFSKDCVPGGTVQFLDKDGKSTTTPNVTLIAGLWTSAKVAKISAAAAGLAGIDAKDFKIKVTGVKDATLRANSIVDTTIDLKASDLKKPSVDKWYTVKAGTAPADDTITFYFSEPMDNDTLKNLANYYVSTTAGAVYTQNKALNAYSDVSVSSVAADGKSITIKAKSIAADKPTFLVYAVKDTAQNMLDLSVGNKGIVKEYASDGGAGPDVVTASAIATDKMTIEFNQSIASFNPSAIKLVTTAGGTTLAAVVVNVEKIDGAKVTLQISNPLGTAPVAYLSVVDVNGVKNPYGASMVTSGAITHAQLKDKVSPTVSFAATTSGIIVNFSEAITTSAISFQNEMILTKDGVIVTNASAVVQSGNKSILIGGLSSAAEYKIQLYPRGYTKDLAVPANNFVATEVYTITTK